MWDILRAAYPMKVYASYFVFCEPYQKPKLSKNDLTLLYKVNYVTPISKSVSALVLVTRREMRQMREGKGFCWPNSSFYFDLPNGRQFFLGNFWETELLAQL